MAEKNRNLWAPWRMEYIDQLGQDEIGGGQSGDGCFLCRYREVPGADATNHVIVRRRLTFILLNRFPYATGHLLVAPLAHAARLDELDEAALLELTEGLRDATRMLEEALHPEGFNIGLNLGRCAGAGLPGHLHWHVVPRWSGDTNFMTVSGDVRVIPMSLESVYERCLAAARDAHPPAEPT